MNNYVEKYIQWKSLHAQRAPITYRIWIERMFKFIDKDFKTWTLDDLISYQNHIQDKYAPVTFQYCVAVMKNFFRFWFVQRKTEISPDLMKIPKVGQKEMTYVTQDDYEHILEFCIIDNSFQEIRRKLIIMILFKTGMRVSELCSLNLAHIDTRTCSALVRTRKNKRFRKVFWDKETNELLCLYLGVRLDLGVSSDALFVGLKKGNRPTHRMCVRTVQRNIKLLCKRAGIKKRISPHTFRHGKGHDMMIKQAPMPLISKVLGHNNPGSTFVYTQYVDKDFELHAKKYL